MAMCWRLGSRMSIERHCSLSLRASEARARRGGVRACCVSVAAMASMVGPRVYRHSETFATGSAAPFGSRAVLGPKKVTKRRAPETSAPRLAARVGEPARLGADVAGRSRTPRCARPSPPAPLPQAGEGSCCCGFSQFGALRKRRVGCRAQRGARQDVEQASSGQGCPVDAPPEHGAPAGDRSRSERRGRRGVFSFGSFSLDKQRKGTRRRRAPEPASAIPKGNRPAAATSKGFAVTAFPTRRVGKAQRAHAVPGRTQTGEAS